MPCFNQGKYIIESVESVLSQTVKDFEIIIIDDGSSDKYTRQLLGNMKFPKTKIYFTENKGVSAARNYGIQQSIGTYILPIDSDDKISSTYLEEAIPILDTNNDIKLVYANGVYFDSKTGAIELPDYNQKTMLKQNLIFNSALYRKIDWLNCGGYDETFLTGWEDWEFWLRLINHPKQVHKLKSIQLHYRIAITSRNSTLIDKRLEHAEQQLYQKHIDKYLEFYPLPINQLREIDFLRKEKSNYDTYITSIYNSLSYRLGNSLLAPFKYFRKNGK